MATASATIGAELLEASGLIDPDYLGEEFELLLQQIEDDAAEIARNARKGR